MGPPLVSFRSIFRNQFSYTFKTEQRTPHAGQFPCHHFGRLLRPGPGSGTVTQLAILHIGPLPDNAQIADIGCGTGCQTFTLARNTDARITAIDILPEFVDKLNRRARQERLESRLTAIEASMESLPFAPGTFDLIWSEGAISHIGFERGMRE